MRRAGAVCALVAIGFVAAGAGDAPEVGDAAAATPAKAAEPLAYPEPLRQRVSESHGLPRFEITGQGTVTWLQTDGGQVMWNWKNRPDDSSSDEWRQLPTLADTITLQPDVEYTFDTVWVDECDDLVIDYPFKADRGLLLRVRRGDTVVFDALRESARRSGKPLAAVVSVQTPPTPAVAATVVAPAENSALGTVLQKLLAARAVCESQEAFRSQWRGDEKDLGVAGGAQSDIDPLVLIEQPLGESSVIVLVYDPRARGAQSVEVSVVEADCPDRYYEPGRTARLEPVDYAGPLFIGRAPIEGVHGTAVKARYRRPGDKQRPAATYESAPIGMAFH